MPAQSTPGDGAEAVSMMNPLTFSWEPSSGAATYGLRVMGASGATVVEALDLATTSHEVTPEGLLVAGASYAWQVRACTGAGCSVWSQPAWTFTMEEGPPVSTETKRFYYLADHLGSVRATVDEEGTVVSYSDYYPFGMQMDGRTSTEEVTRENFTGHELDGESEMLYAGARYYDPVLGRWSAVDPLSDDYPGLSPYNYVLNNPLLYIDPTGNDTDQVASEALVQLAPLAPSMGSRVAPVLRSAGRFLMNGGGAALSLALMPFTMPCDCTLPSEAPQPSLLVEGEQEHVENVEDTRDGITLYRGVTRDHPGYPLALRGIAIPRGGSSTPGEHNLWDTRSIYTSWTTRRDVANFYADGNGVVLTKQFKISRLVPSPDIFGEGEVLVIGTVVGATPSPPTGPVWDPIKGH